MPIQEIENEEQLKQALAVAPGPVALVFKSNDCQPCVADAPKLEQVAEAHPELTVLRIDVDKNDELASKYQAEATPTYYLAKKAADVAPEKCGRRISSPCKEVSWAKDLEKALKK